MAKKKKGQKYDSRSERQQDTHQPSTLKVGVIRVTKKIYFHSTLIFEIYLLPFHIITGLNRHKRVDNMRQKKQI